MIDDQIGYHEGKKMHMGRIAKGLNKLASITFWIGFIFVTVRGNLQFVLAVIDKSSWIKCNGIALDSFIRSFANMLALILPAWASYFTSKLSMNNFDGLSKHYSDVFDSLKELKKKVESIRQNENISYEMLYSLSEDVLMHQINELNDWYAQTAARTIVKL